MRLVWFKLAIANGSWNCFSETKTCVNDFKWVNSSGLSLSIERANVFFSFLIHLDQVVSADNEHWSPNLVSNSVGMNLITYIHELTNM